jgi:hypothetical protein
MLRKQLRGKGERDADSDLSVPDWILAIICSGIGCIMGFVWMAQGKKKGIKMVGVSILASICWAILRAVLTVAVEQQGMQP